MAGTVIRAVTWEPCDRDDISVFHIFRNLCSICAKSGAALNNFSIVPLKVKNENASCWPNHWCQKPLNTMASSYRPTCLCLENTGSNFSLCRRGINTRVHVYSVCSRHSFTWPRKDGSSGHWGRKTRILRRPFLEEAKQWTKSMTVVACCREISARYGRIRSRHLLTFTAGRRPSCGFWGSCQYLISVQR